MVMEEFHHALKFKYELCIGCSHCTGVCPTAAIHVQNGKPILDSNRCIDCGRCYLSCPVNAIYIDQDDFQTIYQYKYPVLLVPSFFSAQFQERISNKAILSAFYHLGFKKVYEVERSVNLLKERYNEILENEDSEKPVISSFCPAIVRLIQVKYPSLVSNISRIKPPLDITALFIKKSLMNEGIPSEDIGIYYVTPCAAKIAAIKSPVGEDKSVIDGVINMNYMYNKVLRTIKQGEYKLVEDEDDFHILSNESILFALTTGEVRLLDRGRNLAIDEVHNVSDFLEKIENEDIDNIDFLELRACDESCAGGILCAGNRFLIAERQRKRVTKNKQVSTNDILSDYHDFLLDNMTVGPVSPRSMDKLDDDISVAMRKMKKSFEINAHLPQVDCRICGYQTCKELAYAIVNQKAELNQCVFIQRTLEQSDKLTTYEAIKVTKKVWGDKKIDKNTLKNLNLE
jgi:iron only hydrogenase large subunit-like protein